MGVDVNGHVDVKVLVNVIVDDKVKLPGSAAGLLHRHRFQPARPGRHGRRLLHAHRGRSRGGAAAGARKSGD